MTQEQLDRLDGHVIAIELAIKALILMHPEARSAAKAIEDVLEQHVASGLGSSRLRDFQIRGIESAKAMLVPSRQQLDQFQPGAA